MPAAFPASAAAPGRSLTYNSIPHPEAQMATIDVPAPVAGIVKAVLVAPGDAVGEGDELVILEAMKMEIPVESPASGSAGELLAAEGDQVEEGQVLLRLSA
jgi:biotin carboxyl carrier protein